MAAKSRPPAKSSFKQVSSDGDGNRVHNQILLALPPEESEMLFPKLEFVRLTTHHVLHEPGDTLKSAYFCNSGLVSILSVFPDGKSVEVGLVGNEGFTGLPLVAGFRTTPTKATIQIEGSAFRVDGDTDANAPGVPETGTPAPAVFTSPWECRSRKSRPAIDSMK